MRARDWLPIVERYAQGGGYRSAWQVSITVAMFIGGWAAMFALVDDHYLLACALALPTALVMVRGFSIQHDCQHGSYFTSRAVSDWVGRALCIMTLVPHGYHRRVHALHHATTGRLDKRSDGAGSFARTVSDFDLITVGEFEQLPLRARRQYRFLRHPIVIFTVVPLYLFLFSYRVPLVHPTSRLRGWISTQSANVAIALVIACMIHVVGLARFAAVAAPTLICYVTIGVWMFYIQHQFEHTYWRRGDEWDYREASLHGSSYLVLPRPLGWLTGDIGIHHLHHLCPRIPHYRLGECLRDHPALAQINRVGVLQSLRMVPLGLWHEQQGRLVGFSGLETS